MGFLKFVEFFGITQGLPTGFRADLSLTLQATVDLMFANVCTLL
jgi:hypothetical protein